MLDVHHATHSRSLLSGLNQGHVALGRPPHQAQFRRMGINCIMPHAARKTVTYKTIREDDALSTFTTSWLSTARHIFPQRKKNEASFIEILLPDSVRESGNPSHCRQRCLFYFGRTEGNINLEELN